MKMHPVVKDMTDRQVVDLMQTDDAINRVRKLFVSGMGKIMQDNEQRTPPSIIDIRKMEFSIAARIMEELGVRL